MHITKADHLNHLDHPHHPDFPGHPDHSVQIDNLDQLTTSSHLDHLEHLEHSDHPTNLTNWTTVATLTSLNTLTNGTNLITLTDQRLIKKIITEFALFTWSSFPLTLLAPGGAHCAPPVTYLLFLCKYAYELVEKNLTFLSYEFGQGQYTLYPVKLSRFLEKK